MHSVLLRRGARPRVRRLARPLGTGKKPRKPRAIPLVRGTQDLLPPASDLVWPSVEGEATGVAERHGFRRVTTPVLEHTELFARTLGDDSDVVSKEMFTFPSGGSSGDGSSGDGSSSGSSGDSSGDSSGSRRKSVSLRPENTAGVMRSLLANRSSDATTLTIPQKVFYCGAMFRYERPQRGRYRQFHQFGVEVVGGPGEHHHPMVDAETIGMGAELLAALGLGARCRLEVNTLGDEESRRGYSGALREVGCP